MLTKQLFADVKSGLVEEQLHRPGVSLHGGRAVRQRLLPHGEGVRPRRRGRRRRGRSPSTRRRANDTGAVQDMLLGINAHVQNDMPFVLASLGLRKPNGDSRKPDHDVANGTLNRGLRGCRRRGARALRPADRSLESRARAARRPCRARAGARLARESSGETPRSSSTRRESRSSARSRSRSRTTPR